MKKLLLATLILFSIFKTEAQCSQLTLNLTTNGPTCAGLCNGTATISVCGGSPGYTVTVYNSSNGYVNTSYMPSPGNYIINGLCGSGTSYDVIVEDANSNSIFGTFSMFNPTNISIFGTLSYSVCQGNCVTINPTVFGGTPPYSYSWSPTASTTLSNSVCPFMTTTYAFTAIDSYSCSNTTTISVTVKPTPTITITNTTICKGSSFSINTFGANTFTWSNGATTSSITETPTITTEYSVVAKSSSNCTNTKTFTVTVDNTCQDVWPGDANSDGISDNLDILELGLHFTQTGTPRAAISNSWQSYFANNWAGTITNGKNLNHSDCNGDGTINNADTLAIYNNYNLNHAFKTVQTTTVNPQLSIVPDQTMVAKGTWGSASIYLGDATTSVNNINGVAFTVNFDNTLIEPNSIYIDYQSSFIDVANQNLDFRKLDFVTGKIFTATTHTVNSNVSGYGKIATLHYQILSSLTTDQVLNVSLAQAYQSDALGTITPLTTGAGTLMAIGASVGLTENLNTNLISINPNPTNGLLTVTSKMELQKIEVVTITGQIVMSEIPNGNNHLLHLDNFANGIYFVNLFQNNHIIKREKVIVNK